MYKIKFDIVGVSPIGFGKQISSVKKDKESYDEHDERVWRERVMTVPENDPNGEACLNPMMLKNCLDYAAKKKGDKVQGKGNSKWSKIFEAGTMVLSPMMLGMKVSGFTVEGHSKRLFVPSDGIKGSGKRVWKRFPLLNEWKTQGELIVVDDSIKPDMVKEYLGYAGSYVGFGTFRPAKGGYWGRFRCENFKVVEE